MIEPVKCLSKCQLTRSIEAMPPHCCTLLCYSNICTTTRSSGREQVLTRLRRKQVAPTLYSTHAFCRGNIFFFLLIRTVVLAFAMKVANDYLKYSLLQFKRTQYLYLTWVTPFFQSNDDNCLASQVRMRQAAALSVLWAGETWRVLICACRHKTKERDIKGFHPGNFHQ